MEMDLNQKEKWNLDSNWTQFGQKYFVLIVHSTFHLQIQSFYKVFVTLYRYLYFIKFYYFTTEKF